MSFTTQNKFMGTELMVRKLLADRLFLTKEEREPEDKSKLITWLTGMAINIRLVVDKSVQAKQVKGLRLRDGNTVKYIQKTGAVKSKKTKGNAFTVEIQLINIRNKKNQGDMLNITVQLVNNNGAFTKWHMSDAVNWFRRAVPLCEYSAIVEIWDGEHVSTLWGLPRKKKVDNDFFYVSASNLIAKSVEMKNKAAGIEKYNKQRALMYKLWESNLKAAAVFYDEVRTA